MPKRLSPERRRYIKENIKHMQKTENEFLNTIDGSSTSDFSDKSKSECNELKRDYHKICDKVDRKSAALDSFYDGNDFDFEGFKKAIQSSSYTKDLQNYIDILNQNKQLIKQCAKKRIQVKYECYKGKFDDGHNVEILNQLYYYTKHSHLVSLIGKKHQELKKIKREQRLREEEKRRREEEKRRREEEKRRKQREIEDLEDEKLSDSIYKSLSEQLTDSSEDWQLVRTLNKNTFKK